jgi:hypothetical protein
VTWLIGVLVAATFVFGVIGIATLLRVIVAWRDYRREQAGEAPDEPGRAGPHPR